MGYTLLGAAFLAAATAAALVVPAAWRLPPETRVGPALSLFMWATAWWAGVNAVGTFGDGDVLAWTSLAHYPATSIALTAFVLLCGRLVSRHWSLSRRATVLLALEPVLIAAFAATNHWHHLLLTDRTGDSIAELSWTPGPLFYVHTVYCYVAGATAIAVVLLAARHGSALQRQQFITVAATAALPLVVNAAALSTSLDGRNVDLTSIAFATCGLLLLYSARSLGLTRVVPMARSQVFDHLRDPILVLDPDGRLLDVNHAAVWLLHRLTDDERQRRIGADVADLLIGPGATSFEDGQHRIELDTGSIHLDLTVNEMRDDRDRLLCRIVMAHDVTPHLRRQADLVEQARRDPLTGLKNRRALSAAIAQLDESSDEIYSLMMVDIDHFKGINDEYGHEVGDAVLVKVADIIAAAARPEDTVVRFGGEEFALVLRGVDAATALMRAEVIRSQCAARPVVDHPGPIEVTVSIGVAGGVAGQDNASAVLCDADMALYEAKQGGRNTATLHSRDEGVGDLINTA